MDENDCKYGTIFSSVALSGTSTCAVDTTCGNTLGVQILSSINESNQIGILPFIPTSTIATISLLLFKSSSESSGTLDDIYDKTDYSSVERNAKLIYDKFNKTHDIDESISVLITPTPELARKLDEILKSGDKETLYEALTALQEVLKEIENQKSDQAKLEFKQK